MSTLTARFIGLLLSAGLLSSCTLPPDGFSGLEPEEIAARALQPEWKQTAEVLGTGNWRIAYHGEAVPDLSQPHPEGEWRGVVKGEIVLLLRGSVGVGSYLEVGKDGQPQFKYGSARQTFLFQNKEGQGMGARQLSPSEIDGELRKVAYGGN